MTNYRTDGIPHSIVKGWANSRQYGTGAINLGLGYWGGGRAEYLNGGLIARIVDIPADGSVKQGVKVEGADQQLYAEMDRLRVLPALADALRWARLDGAGALVVVGDQVGASELAEPLDGDKLLTITDLRTVSVADVSVNGEAVITDQGSPYYGWPESYKIKFGADGNNETVVHHTRIIPVPGDPVPTGRYATDVTRIPWNGRGLSAAVLQAVREYRQARQWAGAMLERKQRPVNKMSGLAEMLMAGQESVVRSRLDLIDANSNLMTSIAVDGQDDYTLLNADVSGVDKLLQEAQVAVSAESGLPVTVLFGRSPGGLNATGTSDWAIVYELCAQLQTDRLTPALERVVSLIFAQKQPRAKGMKAPEQWQIVWNGLEVLSQTQQAEVENKRADSAQKVATALEKLTGIGAVSQDEAHAYLQAERAYGLEPEDGGDNPAAARGYAGGA